jgi:hypothetical protein
LRFLAGKQGVSDTTTGHPGNNPMLYHKEHFVGSDAYNVGSIDVPGPNSIGNARDSLGELFQGSFIGAAKRVRSRS